MATRLMRASSPSTDPRSGPSNAASISATYFAYLASCSASMSTSIMRTSGFGSLSPTSSAVLNSAYRNSVSRSSCRFWKPVTAARSTTSILVSTTGLSSMRR